jgi:glycine C-acetyltransferase
MKLVTAEMERLRKTGGAKGREDVISGVLPLHDEKGPRYTLEGHGETPFLRMNSNSYLGLSLHRAVMDQEERAVTAFGAGPGAVRFISGTWSPHVELEARLASFHGREAAILFSSAYAAMMGILPPLITPDTVVISDALNHNCIINAIRLGQPRSKLIYPHLDLDQLDKHLRDASESCRRAIVVTDGIFSMRGDYAPLDEIVRIARAHDGRYPENVLVVVDDSHGVGAFGPTGRGVEEATGADGVDILIATLGKAFGVNGGYAVTAGPIIDFLRERSPFYIYSNPITPGEAAAARRALEIVDSAQGHELISHLRAMTQKFENGLSKLGFETIPGQHPIVPLVLRDTKRTKALTGHLRDRHILATGLSFPVVPKGDEEIRFQISAEHTAADIDHALAALSSFSD